MNFDFSPEQKQFGEQVRRLLAQVSPLSEARRALEGEIAFSETTWKALAKLGFQAISIPSAFEGLGLSALEVCVAAEEIGRSLAPVPSTSSVYLCTEAIRLFGSEGQKRQWLPGLARGDLIGAWACDESPTACSPTHCRDGRLIGAKSPVLDGAVADIAVVSAIDNGVRRLFLCALRQPEIDRRRVENVDPVRPVAELRFDRAGAEPLGVAGEAERKLLLNRAAILLAFEQVGAADAALFMARDYALERKSFGRPIGSYQAIKHKLANVYAKNQLARSHAYYGAWALATNAPQLSLAAAGARVAATDAFSFAAQENLQTHGGMGYTWASDCQLFYRRARQNALLLGPPPVWREQILKELAAEAGRD